jgi:hypothetical protein
VHGSFKDLFDGPTAHRPNGHLVVWSLRHLADELRTVGTLLALDHLFRMAKAARKRHAGLTVATHDAADLLSTDLGRAVVANAATQILLRQAPQAIDAVGDAFALTAGERRRLLAARRGLGLLINGTNRTEFEAIASDTEHQLIGTDQQLDVVAAVDNLS